MEVYLIKLLAVFFALSVTKADDYDLLESILSEDSKEDNHDYSVSWHRGDEGANADSVFNSEIMVGILDFFVAGTKALIRNMTNTLTRLEELLMVITRQKKEDYLTSEELSSFAESDHDEYTPSEGNDDSKLQDENLNALVLWTFLGAISCGYIQEYSFQQSQKSQYGYLQNLLNIPHAKYVTPLAHENDNSEAYKVDQKLIEDAQRVCHKLGTYLQEHILGLDHNASLITEESSKKFLEEEFSKKIYKRSKYYRNIKRMKRSIKILRQMIS